jgi:hypothetical protein
VLSETPPAAPVFPPGRYGRRRSGRKAPRTLVAIGIVLTIAAMGWVGLRLYLAYGETDYSASVTRFTLGEREVAVEFTVRVPAGKTASCLVRARNRAGAEVGRQTVEVPAGPEPDKTVMTYRLITTDKPVTGEVRGCVPVEGTATLR